MNRKKIYTALSISLGILFIAIIWIVLTGAGLENPGEKTLNDKKHAQMVLWTGRGVRLDQKTENRLKSDKENLNRDNETSTLESHRDSEVERLIEAEKRQRKDVIGQASASSKENSGKASDSGGGKRGQDGSELGSDKVPGTDKPNDPKPDSNPSENKKAPQITTDIKAGKVYAEAYATFYVEAEDYKGVSILWPGKYQVTLNGKELDGSVRYNYKDEDVGRNYQTGLNQGENLIKISVVDSKGNSITQEYVVYGDKDLAPDKYDQINAFVKINLSNLGLTGIDRTKLIVRKGISAQKLVYDFLTSQGYVVNGGKLADPYLSSLAKSAITKGWSLSEKQKAYLSKYGDVSGITLNPDILGEKDTTQGSGYMWRLNGYDQPPYSLASYSLVDGDVIEIWWTNDYGADYENH